MGDDVIDLKLYHDRYNLPKKKGKLEKNNIIRMITDKNSGKCKTIEELYICEAEEVTNFKALHSLSTVMIVQVHTRDITTNPLLRIRENGEQLVKKVAGVILTTLKANCQAILIIRKCLVLY